MLTLQSWQRCHILRFLIFSNIIYLLFLISNVMRTKQVLYILLSCMFSMNLTVSFFSTKYMKHAAGCPSLPYQMKLHYCPMDDLPCYGGSDHPYGYDYEDDNNSNDNEECASYSNERLEGSVGDSLQSDNISCAVQRSTDKILLGERLVIGDQLVSDESSSIRSTLKEHTQPLHQLPFDVSGLTMNTLNEMSRCCEEILIEDDKRSFPVLEEHIHIAHASEKDLRTGLDENLPLGHMPPASTGNDLDEQFQQKGSSIREQSSIVNLQSSVAENTAKKDSVTCIIIDDNTEDPCGPTKVQSPLRFVNTDRPYSNEGIEIIELCTPSPKFRVTVGSKKKRAISDFPDFIDLTGSPSFVQL